MNFQQLEYIIAVDETKQFAKAAERCFVTQPTLSMMIQKLENELDIKIFDRSKLPVVTTIAGSEVIRRAKLIVAETKNLTHFARELNSSVSGTLKLGVIPTLAPYLLPLILKPIQSLLPELKLVVKEMITSEIVQSIRNGDLDAGLLAGPLNESTINEMHLFYEAFYVYANPSEKLPKKKYLLPSQLNFNRMLLLEEGHCFRNQIVNLCELKLNESIMSSFEYSAGSIETLIHLVDINHGLTIIPHLSLSHMSKQQLNNIRSFAKPRPVRDVCLAVHNDFPRKVLLKKLFDCILNAVPFHDSLNKDARILDF